MKIIAPRLHNTHIVKMFALSVLGIGVFLPHTVSGITLDTLTLQAGDHTETLAAEDILRFTRLDTHISYSPAVRSEIQDTSFCPTEQLFCAFSLSRSLRQHLHIVTTSTVDTGSIQTFLKEFADKVVKEPVDVKFTVTNDRVVVAEPEQVGYRLQEADSIILLARVLETTQAKTARVTLPTEITQPKLVASDRERLGLKELVGEGRTNFKGSPKNRIYNIVRSLEQFQNIIIAPGEEFSFVDYLGEVDGEHGYLPELVIKNNETIPEFGGGICQVSTTVFRAAIYSGMKITQRRQHAYPVKYYAPYGMDATIYIPKPDLAFVNNTPGAILMQSTIVGTELTFRFYGTKDGRAVSVDGPHILQSNPDGSMKTVFSQLVTDASGNNLINDSFWSNYKSPSLFPHPGDDPIYTTKPKGWSEKQWSDYRKIHP
ncbi:MAG: VanW family protein [Candidatus Moraniibacteriota bacterium]